MMTAAHESSCTISALSTSPARSARYSAFQMDGADEALPDGEYTVAFGTKAICFRKRGGVWECVQKP